MAGQLGPSSFVREVAGVASQARATTPAGINRSIGEGGGYAPISYAQGGEFEKEASNRNAMIQSIVGFANKLAEPTLIRKQQEQFAFGMQMAANGKALSEIKEDQPWLAKLVGDTFITEGARKYTAAAASTDYIAGIQQDMDELRKLSPDEFRQELTRRMNESLTGDAQADTEIMGNGLQQMAPLMSSHFKANFEWKQDEYAKAFGQNLLSVGRNTAARQKMVSEGFMSQEEANALNERDIMAAMQPPANLDPERAQQVVGETLSALSQGGYVSAIGSILGVQERMADAGQINPGQYAAGFIANRTANAIAQDNYMKDPNNQVFVGGIAGQIEVLDKQLEMYVLRGDTANAERIRAEIADKLSTLNGHYQSSTGSKEQILSYEKVAGKVVITSGLGTLQRQMNQERAALERQQNAIEFSGRNGAINATFGEALDNMLKTGELVVPDTYIKKLVEDGIISPETAQSDLDKIRTRVEQSYDRIQKVKENGGGAIFNVMENLYANRMMNATSDEERKQIHAERQAFIATSKQQAVTDDRVNSEANKEDATVRLNTAKGMPEIPNGALEVFSATPEKDKPLIFSALRDDAVDKETGEIDFLRWAENLTYAAKGYTGDVDKQLRQTFDSAAQGWNSALFGQALGLTEAFNQLPKSNTKFSGYAQNAFIRTVGGEDNARKWNYIAEEVRRNPEMDQKDLVDLHARVFLDPGFTVPKTNPTARAPAPNEDIVDVDKIQTSLFGPRGVWSWITGTATTNFDVDSPMATNIVNAASQRVQQLLENDVTMNEEVAIRIVSDQMSREYDFEGLPAPAVRTPGTVPVRNIIETSSPYEDKDKIWDRDLSSQVMTDIALLRPNMTMDMFEVIPKKGERLLNVEHEIYSDAYTFTVQKPGGETEVRIFKAPPKAMRELDETASITSTMINGKQVFMINNYDEKTKVLMSIPVDAEVFAGYYRLRNFLKQK